MDNFTEAYYGYIYSSSSLGEVLYYETRAYTKGF